MGNFIKQNNAMCRIGCLCSLPWTNLPNLTGQAFSVCMHLTFLHKIVQKSYNNYYIPIKAAFWKWKWWDDQEGGRRRGGGRSNRTRGSSPICQQGPLNFKARKTGLKGKKVAKYWKFTKQIQLLEYAIPTSAPRNKNPRPHKKNWSSFLAAVHCYTLY